MNASPTPSLPASAAPARPPRRRRMAYLVLLVMVAGGLLLLGSDSSYSDTAWTEVEMETDRLDPRWRLVEIEADRAEIPAAENSALHIVAVQRQGRKISVVGAPHYNQIFAKLAPPVRLNTQQIELIEGELGKIAQPLEDARRLKDMPRGRFAVKIADDFFSTKIPDHHKTRWVTDWLRHDAWLLAHQERHGQAVESCQAILCAGRAMEDDPFLISRLIRLALRSESLLTLERVLAQGEAPEESLAAMQVLLAREVQESNWTKAVRGERAGAHHLFDNIRAGKVSLNAVRGMLSAQPAHLSEWLHEWFPAMLLQHFPDYQRQLNRCVEITKLPTHEQIAPFKQWEADRKASQNPVIRLLTPSFARAHQAELRSVGMLRSALAAVACERYRQRHKHWPATLDELVHEKLLDAVPTDPIDHQPIRYRRETDLVILYSIGTDHADNRGRIDRDHDPHQSGYDFGFRLWSVPLRRAPSLPPVILPTS